MMSGRETGDKRADPPAVASEVAGALSEERVKGDIAAAARMCGIEARITGDAEWSVRDGQVTVGLAAYQRAAPSGKRLTENALTALALLDLWAVVRTPRSAPQRTDRRVRLGRTREHLEPLLQTIDRLQAYGELVTAFPAFRGGLEAAVTTLCAGDLTEQLPSDQLRTALLLQGLAARQPLNEAITITPEVRAQLVSVDQLQLALSPLQPSDPSRTFARLLALTLPRYEALLAAIDHGLTDAGQQASDTVTPVNGEGSDLDSPAGEGAGAGADEDAQAIHREGADGEAAGDERARAGNAPESAEGADLFEAEQAGAVRHMLDTPMPVSGAAAQALREFEVAAQAKASAVEHEAFAAVRAQTQVRVTTYRDRLHAFTGEIEAMREVWREIITDRAAAVHRFSRTAEAEGDMLHRESLPAALAEALAGVPRPRAYTARTHGVRNRREPGHTDIVILIDRSGSMRHAAPIAAEAAMVMIEALAAVSRDIEAEERLIGEDLELSLRTALIVFDAEAVVVKPLAAASDDEARARLFAEALTVSGGTNDIAAFEAAASELGLTQSHLAGGDSRTRIVVMISDGGSSDRASADHILAWLRARGVTVYGIGVRSDEVAERFAPHGQRVDQARDIVGVLQGLIAATAARMG